jgi:rfaE bifunctional protein kinase chain/domain
MESMQLRERVRQCRVLVVGDVMLDRYWFGEANRISPEAPVPVVLVGRSEDRLGGAGNVARNCAALGAQARLLSVVGNDEAGGAVKALAGAAGVDASLFVDGGVSTTIKLRVIARQQQLIRIDFEAPPSHEVLGSKLDEFLEQLPLNDAVVLSDYGKGGLTHIERMIEAARRANKPVLVDPKGNDYRRYRGATLLTPNRAEMRQAVGIWADELDLQRRADDLRRSLELAGVLLTRSEEGMSLFTANGVEHIAAEAREVFDVSGAGDTVVAVLGVMLGAGLSVAEAMTMANRAAGIVVGKFGTAVASADELFSAPAQRSPPAP